MSAPESKKAVKRRKNKKASCGLINNSNEFAFSQDNIFRDQAMADMDNLISSDDLPKSAIPRGQNPFLGVEQCLLCHRKRSNPPSPEPNLEKGDGCEETSKLLRDTASLAQLPLWVCAECRHSVEEDTQADCSDYPLLAPDNLFLHSAPHDLTSCAVQDSHCSDSSIGSCETCARKRLEEQESNQLQTDWIELHYAIWQIYRNVGIGDSETDSSAQISESLSMEKIQELVDRLCLLDPQQLFQRLETQVHEAMINSKMHLLQLLPVAVAASGNKQSILEAASQFVQALLNDYSKLCSACAQLAPLLKQLESENLKKFNLTWELVNRHLFQSIVHMDPLIQKSLPSFVSHLRAAAQDGNSSSADSAKSLYEHYLKFNDEMTAISTVWQREAEHFIQEYNAEQLALKAKQKMLQDDWELFKMQRKLLEQQLQKDKIPITDDCSASFNDTMQQMLSGNKSMIDDCHCPHCNKNQCPCDECSISHMLTCGLITPPETPIPDDELLVAAAPPPLSSETAAQFLHASLASAMANAGKVLENTGCSNSTGHNCSQGHSRHHQHHLHTQAEFLLREVVDHHKDLNLVGMEELSVQWGRVDNEDDDDDDYEDDCNEEEEDEDDEEDDDEDGEDEEDGDDEDEENNGVSSPPKTNCLSSQSASTKENILARTVSIMSSSSSETVGSSNESVTQSCECHVCTAPPNGSLPPNSTMLQDTLLDRSCDCQQHSTSLASPTVNPQPLSLHLYPHIHGEINTSSHLLRPTVPLKPLIHPHLYNLHGPPLVLPQGKHRTITSSASTLLNSLDLGSNHMQQYSNCAASVLQDQLYRTYGDCDNVYDNGKTYHNPGHKLTEGHGKKNGNPSNPTTEVNSCSAKQQACDTNCSTSISQVTSKPISTPCSNGSSTHGSMERAGGIDGNCPPISTQLPTGFLDNFHDQRPHSNSSQPSLGHQNLNAPQPEAVSNVAVAHSKESVSTTSSNDVPTSTTNVNTSLRSCDSMPSVKKSQSPTAGKQPQQQQSTCNGISDSKTLNAANGVQSNGQCSDPDCDASRDQDDSVDDSCSEQSSSTSASNQKDSKHCDCCYCEVFGHGTPTVAPVSKNYIEMRERLRLRLTKRKSKCKNNITSAAPAPPAIQVAPATSTPQPNSTKASLPAQDVDTLVSFINGTGGSNCSSRSEASSKAAKRARQKQRKAEEKAKKQQEKPPERTQPQEKNQPQNVTTQVTKKDNDTTTAKTKPPTSGANSKPRVVSLESLMEEMRKGDMAGKGTKDSILKKVIEAVKAGDSSNNHTPTIPSSQKIEPKATKSQPSNSASFSKWSVSLQSLVAAAGQAGLEIVPIPTPDAKTSEETNKEASATKEAKEEIKANTKSNKKKKGKGNESEKTQSNTKTVSVVATPVIKKEETKPQPSVIITKGKINQIQSQTNFTISSQLPSGVSISCITPAKDVKNNCTKPEVDIISIKSGKVPTDDKKRNGDLSKTVSVRVIEANPKIQPVPAVQVQQVVKAANSSKKKKSKSVPITAPQAQVITAPTVVQNKKSNVGISQPSPTVQVTSQTKGTDSKVTVISISSPSPFSNKTVPTILPSLKPQGKANDFSNGTHTTEPTVVLKQGKLKNNRKDDNTKPESTDVAADRLRKDIKTKHVNGICNNSGGNNTNETSTGSKSAQSTNKNASNTTVTARTKKNKKKKGSGDDLKSIDEVFVPRDIDLDNGELDESERELEAFKRFCWNSIPLANKEKVHVNLKDIVIKKKSVLSCS